MFQIEPADMICVKGEGWISKGIKFVTASEFSHIACGFNKHFIFETHIDTKARIRPAKGLIGKQVVIYRPNLNEMEKLEFKSLCIDMEGHNYGKIDIFMNAFFRPLDYINQRWRMKAVAFMGSQKTLVCSAIYMRNLAYCSDKFPVIKRMYEAYRPDDCVKFAEVNKFEKVFDGIY